MTRQPDRFTTTAALPRRAVRLRLMASGATALAIVALLAAPQQARAQLSPTQSFQGTGTVVSGGASIAQTGTQDTVRITSSEAVINWRPNDTSGTGSINFLPSGRRVLFSGDADFTVFNRIIPVNGAGAPVARLIELNGQIDSLVAGQQGGNVWFYSPGGILVGGTGVFNVGSLVLSTRDIDTNGGLFGPGGTIRFAGSDVATPGTITIASNAVINADVSALPGSSYVALVAPRIEQAGTIRANGSVALVAAETVDITVNAGLFDIFVTTGSDDANGIVHTGQTGGPTDTSSDYESRAYLVAIPKSQAMTMLLSGTIGFQTNLTAGIDATGGIVLSAGNNVSLGQDAGDAGAGGRASISIADTLFWNTVEGVATNAIVGRPTLHCAPNCLATSNLGQIGFYRGGTLSAANRVDLSVGQAQRIFAIGNLALAAETPGVGGTVNLSVDDTTPGVNFNGDGEVDVTGSLTLNASTRGSEFVNGVATGGTAVLSAIQGRIRAAQINVLASAEGGTDLSGIGQLGQGGTARADAGAGGTIEATFGTLSIQADGLGGQDIDGIPIDRGGNGRGGNANLTVSGGTVTTGQGLTVSANGLGGVGRQLSGDGTGGTARVSVSGASAVLDTNFAFVVATGRGGGTSFNQSTGFVESADGGNGIGGQADVAITGTDGVDISFLQIDASGDGGVSTQPAATGVTAGDGRGGTAGLTIDASLFTPNSLTVRATGIGADASGSVSNGGNGTGGAAFVRLTNDGDLAVQSSAMIDASASGGVGANLSGDGSGGSAVLSAGAGSTVQASSLTVDASGLGGGAFTASASFAPNTRIGGNGRGGLVEFATEDAVNVVAINLVARAIGGDANPSPSATGLPQGGSASGGRIEVSVTGGIITGAVMTANATAIAGSSGTNAGRTGFAFGGQVISNIFNSTWNLTSALSMLSDATARLGDGGTVAGLFGGQVLFQADNSNFNIGGSGVLFDASAGSPNATAAQAGVGVVDAGIVTLTLANGRLNTPSLTLAAAARGARNGGSTASGEVSGGTAELRANADGIIAVANALRLDASAIGGDAFEGAVATGGVARLLAFSGGIDAPADISAATTDIDVRAVSGGLLGAASVPAALGGQVSLVAAGIEEALLSLGGLTIEASASNASTAAMPTGYTGPIGGDAQGGFVEFEISGGGRLVADDSDIRAEGLAAAGGTGRGGIFELDAPSGSLAFNLLSISLLGSGGNGIATRDGGQGFGGNARFSVGAAAVQIGNIGISANGRGGDGLDGFITASGDLSPGAGGSGQGGSIDFTMNGGSITAGSVALTADGFGGDGGDFDPGTGTEYFAPGRGGSAQGGTVTATMAGGTFNGDVFDLYVRGQGGDGGVVLGSGAGNLALRGPAGGAPDGGTGSGGIASFIIAGGTFDFTPLIDASAFGGVGGSALAGARGGNALGGTAEVIVDDVDGGTLAVTLLSNAEGGSGGNALHGAGGDGGNGVAGRVAASTSGNSARATITSTNFMADGTGGIGGAGANSTAFTAVQSGFSGGRGGDGTGGEVAITSGGGELLADAGSGFAVSGIGGAGGSGANNPGSGSTATFGGNGGNGGSGTGGTISLVADGGLLGSATTGTLALGAAATAGAGGAGGTGTIVGTLNPSTGQTIFSGGDGFGGSPGFGFGGTTRLIATEAPGSLIAFDTLDINVSGDIGGRVELIDDSDGAGLELGTVSIAADGSSTSFGNVALGGSGVYFRSALGAMQLDNLSISTGSDVQFDALGTGGFEVDGDLDIATNGHVLVTHIDRPGNGRTIAADRMDIVAERITLDSGTLVYGSDLLFLSAALDLAFDELLSDGGDIVLGANGFIAGNSVVASPTALTSGTISINSGFGTTVATLDAGGSIDVNGGGVSTVTTLVSRSGGAFLGGTGVAVDNASVATDLIIRTSTGDVLLGTVTSGGAIDVAAGRDVRAGSLTSSGNGAIAVQANGQIRLGNADTQGAVRLAGNAIDAAATGTIRAAGGLTALSRNGALTLGNIVAGSVDLDSPNGIVDFRDMTASGQVTVDGQLISGTSISGPASIALSGLNGVDITLLHGGSTVTLAAANGTVRVANLRSPAIDARGRAVDLTTTATSTISVARATAGNILVRSDLGNLSVGDAEASGNIDVRVANGTLSAGRLVGRDILAEGVLGVTLSGNQTASGLLDIRSRRTATINGIAVGATIAITSGDIVIGSNARVGQAGTTTQLSLTNGDSQARTFVGGNDTSAGYSLSAAEMQRLFANNIAVLAPRVVTGSATAAAPTAIVGSTRQPDLTIDSFTLSGGSSGNLGASGTLRIETPGFARVIGSASLTNAAPGNRLTLVGQEALEIILGQGSVRVSNGGALAGTLELVSQDVVVATAAAIADIAAAAGNLSRIDDRLASNDGIASGEGAISADTIRITANGVYIQNTGTGTRFAERRGYTAGSGGLVVNFPAPNAASPGGSGALIVNGRSSDGAGGFLTGLDAFPTVTVGGIVLATTNQSVNGLIPGSTLNGCDILGAGACREFTVVLPEQDNPLIEEDDEESEQTGGESDPPGVLIELRELGPLPNEPLVDDPVTGAGNDDLWAPLPE